MELYDKAYFKELKEKILPLLPVMMRNLLYVIISITFFFVWCNLIIEIGQFVGSFFNKSHWVFLFTGAAFTIIFPITLLVNILKHQNSKAYLIVVMVMFLSIIVEFIELLYYYDLYIGDPKQGQGILDLINLESTPKTPQLQKCLFRQAQHMSFGDIFISFN